MKIKLLFALIFFIPEICCAFFCPNTFNQINVGDSLDQVEQACGKPDKESSAEVKAKEPQEWVYFIPQAVNAYSLAPTQGAPQGTLKTSITFDNTGKAINISVNGLGVGATTICNNINIQLGATTDDVKAACGDPSFVNKQNGTSDALGTQAPPTKVTTITYGAVGLTFEGGKLTGKSSQ